MDQKIFELTKKESEMTVTKRDLQSLRRQFKALEKKMDKLIAVAGKSEKPKAANKRGVPIALSILIAVRKSEKLLHRPNMICHTSSHSRGSLNHMGSVF